MMLKTPSTFSVRPSGAFAAQSRSLRPLVLAALKQGDKAPEFELKNQNGKLVKVKYGGFGAKPTVLFFYPKDNTPGCTLEAKAFRDSFAELKKIGVKVYGISSDSPESHNSFCSELELPYDLLADEGDKIRNIFGVPKDLLGLLPGRQTYVISKDGKVVLVYNNQFQPETHVKKVIEVLAA